MSALSDERLQERLRALAWGERQVLAAFLRHLREFDRRRAYTGLGFDSLFKYCTARLGLSEDEACLRILAARLAARFPEVLGMLARGETHLSQLARLAPHLTNANAAALLDAARGKSKRDVERLAASFGAPGPSMDTVRFLPAPARGGAASSTSKERAADQEGELRLGLAGSPGTGSLDASGAAELGPAHDTGAAVEPGTAAGGSPAAAAAEAGKPSPAAVERSGPRLVRISFTASEALWGKIERARALLRHKHPAGRLEPLVDEAFEALLDLRDPGRRPPARRAPVRSASTGSARAAGSGVSRRIPRWVKDVVWRRDGGRCAFVAPDGLRCDAASWLEYDHVRPFALGGPSDDPANVRLLCRAHNQHEAREVFGPGHPFRNGD